MEVWGRGRLLVACLGAMALGAAASGEARADGGPAEAPAAYCARVGTDDSSHSLPHDMADSAERAFGLRLPVEMGERAVIWRCDGGRVLGCFFGANVPCGQMDQRTELPEVSEWCEAHPNAGVPQAVAGQDTAWRWRCEDTKAVRGGAAWTLDHRGFVEGLWRPLGPATAAD